MTEKSILEQALLQVQNLEEAVKQNAKGILASTMKQELNDLLKESEEEDVEELPEEEENDMSEQPNLDSEDDEEEEDVDDENLDTLDNEDEDEESVDDFEDEESMDDEFSDDSSIDSEMPSFGDEGDDDDDVVDMTNASHDEVLKVFKAMKPEDGIIVKKDGDDIDVDVDGDEYIIKLDDQDDSVSGGGLATAFGDEFGGDEFSDDLEGEIEDEMGDDELDADADEEDDTIYEIELDEEDELEETALVAKPKVKQIEANEGSLVAKPKVKQIEANEAARTKSNPHGDKGTGEGRTGLKSKKMYKAGSGNLNEQVETLKKQNSEYKKALVLFKEKLNEVAVFNANLAYATRLFTEHSTTKQEKLNILKRFDTIGTMNESKSLFNTIKSELGNKKPITESVVEKLTNTQTTSSSQEILSEAKAYENPQFKRMRDLMSKLK